MKTILVPTQNIPSMSSALETAVLLAQRTGAYIEGTPLWFGVPEFVVAELATGFSMEIYRARRDDETSEARTLFETFMQEHGVSATRGTAGAPWYGWFEEVSQGESLVGSHGRVFDIIVMNRPDADSTGPYNRAIESALFESGRPVLLAPPAAPQTDRDQYHGPLERQHRAGPHQRLRHAAVAAAERVSVLTVIGGQDVPGPSAEAGAQAIPLQRHCRKTREHRAGGRSTGEAVLAAAAAQGADLLIKGAFTRNRLRQMIFGGATSHIMQFADLPVLMAH